MPQTGVKQGVVYLHAPFKLTVAVVSVFSAKSKYFSHALGMRERERERQESYSELRLENQEWGGRIEYLT